MFGIWEFLDKELFHLFGTPYLKFTATHTKHTLQKNCPGSKMNV
jgi:hypothetical protein